MLLESKLHVMIQSIGTLMHSLYDHFMLIYDAWDEGHSTALAKKMLEEDITRLGLFLSVEDEFGQRSQLALVAECVAYIRMFDTGMDTRNTIDYWIDVVLEEMHHHRIITVSHKQSIADIVEQLQTWALTRELLDRNRVSHDMAESFAQHYLELADMFFLRNGNISSREMTWMGELETALKIS